VLPASAAELEAHAEYLRAMGKECGEAPVW
jgi:hypothetical protein